MHVMWTKGEPQLERRRALTWHATVARWVGPTGGTQELEVWMYVAIHIMHGLPECLL